MTPVSIRPITVAEVQAAPGIDALLAEYAAESATNGMGQAIPQWPIYQAMEAAGFCHILGAECDGKLVGLLVMMCAVLPHYGQLTATSESYFVAAEHRKTGAGLALFREAKRVAQGLGCAGLFISAPVGGRLTDVMAGLGMRHTNDVFFVGLA
ncbi:MAG TPA: GNAT family N-acetyltransferase [Ramlibacter sp.]|nr:GNAT family N-acetyltransferase [Ramlibacter sp.]